MQVAAPVGMAVAVLAGRAVDDAAVQRGLEAVELVARQVGVAVDDDAADRLALGGAERSTTFFPVTKWSTASSSPSRIMAATEVSAGTGWMRTPAGDVAPTAAA